MKISGFEKLTLLDYPGYVASIIFTMGCNFNCPYCHNSLFLKNSNDIVKETEIFNYLEKRKKILDGVVISGGEPTIQNDLIDFITKIKQLGLKVKLDTNGHNPKVLEKLIKDNLVDYIAMDIKHTFNNYNKIIGSVKFNPDKIIESINLLKNSSVDYEFRTTIIKDYHTKENISKILNIIGNDSKYYLQNFEDSENVIDKSLKSFSEEELFDIYKYFKKDYPKLRIRGLKNKLYDKEDIVNV